MVELEQINLFLDKKNIFHPIARESVIKFVTEHTRNFGHIITQEMLITRLEENLDKIVLEDPTNRLGKNVVGVYEGFEKKQITMFFSEQHLLNEKLKTDFINILIHELTHAAYTIRNNDIHKTENHVFGTRMKLLNGEVALVSGNDALKEAIINFISTKFHKDSTGAYIASTNQIDKLSQIIGTDIIIVSAWESDENKLQESFSVFSVLNPYGRFKNRIRSLNIQYSQGDIETIDKILSTANQEPNIERAELLNFRNNLESIQALHCVSSDEINEKKGHNSKSI